MFKRIFFSIICFLTLGCQTPGYFISDSNLTMSESRKAIGAVIGKPRFMSSNGRELVSEYHDAQFKQIEPNQKPIVRYVTTVSLLGVRRPYEINVQVVRQSFERQTRAYVNTGLDEGLSQKRAKEIKKILNYSLEKQQKFDGESPF